MDVTSKESRLSRLFLAHIFRRLFRRCIFQQGNVQPHTACITGAWLRSRRVWGLKWPLCSPGLSLTENDLAHYEMKNSTTDCWAARVMYQTRVGQHSSPKSSATDLSYKTLNVWTIIIRRVFLDMCCCCSFLYSSVNVSLWLFETFLFYFIIIFFLHFLHCLSFSRIGVVQY